MIDRKVSDKPVYFELSIGNAGNSIDGHNESQCTMLGEEGELETVDTTSFNSTTNSCKPISHDKLHCYLPYWDYKPCMNVRCHFPDLRRRMYNSNMIAKIAEALVIQSFVTNIYSFALFEFIHCFFLQEESLHETNALLEEEDPRTEVSKCK